jgi:hypothetical protein
VSQCVAMCRNVSHMDMKEDLSGTYLGPTQDLCGTYRQKTQSFGRVSL